MYEFSSELKIIVKAKGKKTVRRISKKQNWKEYYEILNNICKHIVFERISASELEGWLMMTGADWSINNTTPYWDTLTETIEMGISSWRMFFLGLNSEADKKNGCYAFREKKMKCVLAVSRFLASVVSRSGKLRLGFLFCFSKEKLKLAFDKTLWEKNSLMPYTPVGIFESSCIDSCGTNQPRVCAVLFPLLDIFDDAF